MSKNRLSSLNQKKKASETSAHPAEEEARQHMDGIPPWEDETRDARVSMRVEPSLKKAFEAKLPRFVSITDAIRDYMKEVAKGERDPV